MGDIHVLIVAVREIQEDRDHVFIWNLLTLHLQLLVSAKKLLTAATVTAQQAITVSHRLVKSWGKAPGQHLPASPTSPTFFTTPTSPTSPTFSTFSTSSTSRLSPRPLISNGSWSSRSSSSSFFQRSNGDGTHDDDDDDDDNGGHMDEEPSQRQVRPPGNRRQLLILGHRNNWMSIYKFQVSLTGQVTCAKASSSECRGLILPNVHLVFDPNSSLFSISCRSLNMRSVLTRTMDP